MLINQIAFYSNLRFFNLTPTTYSGFARIVYINYDTNLITTSTVSYSFFGCAEPVITFIVHNTLIMVTFIFFPQ